MTITPIQQSIEGVVKFFSEHPERGRSADKPAVATVQERLLCKAEGPNALL